MLESKSEFYNFDEASLEDLRRKSPWTSDPKFFTSVSVSPTAIVKMLTHCQSGVEKGIKQGGRPIEVMGLMLGRPDPTKQKRLIVTDVFPLPIEGFETRVIADDHDVVNYMIALGESLEVTRKEKFMGWYHSHPFDLSHNSHCFLSQTDLSTQLQWQRAEDPHGNPFLAMVVDPLRCLHMNEPEVKAFRAYPPEYKSPTPNECPDGSIEGDERIRLERWGSCWDRYYELDVDFFMSSAAKNVLNVLTKNLWMRALSTSEGSTVMGHSSKEINDVRKMIKGVDVNDILNHEETKKGADVKHKPGPNLSSNESEAGGTMRNEINLNKEERNPNAMFRVSSALTDYATGHIHEGIVQDVKKKIF
jgi:COP9 signalosome complex subunit 5